MTKLKLTPAQPNGQLQANDPFCDNASSIAKSDNILLNKKQNSFQQHAPESLTLPQDNLDHFIVRDGIAYAGTHLLIDIWGAQKLDDLTLMENTLRKAIATCGATLLHIHLHHFTLNGGISGVAVLAESHISVHTWPERGYAAFDVFMCGDAMPRKSIPVIKNAFSPNRIDVNQHLRGVITYDQ